MSKNYFFSAIFALRDAPDPEEIKYELDHIRDKIRSKPLPFFSGKGKKKKEKFHQTTYSTVPTYTPELSTYGNYDTTSKPITFSFDVTENYNYNSNNNNKRRVQDEDYSSNLIGPVLSLGGTPGP